MLPLSNKPTLYMLCGVPGSGKSTYCNMLSLMLDAASERYVILSTDNYIQAYAEERGLTYNQAFEIDCVFKFAQNDLNEAYQYCIDNNYNIIWDQTNLTKKTRAQKLKKIPAHYQKVAIAFMRYNKQSYYDVNTAREITGKFLKKSVLTNMIRSFQMPSKKEGFDFVTCQTII